MAQALDRRSRGVVKGDGAWRPYMAKDDERAMYPSEVADAEVTNDVTTLNPDALLKSVKFMRLKKAATVHPESEIGVVFNQPGTESADGFGADHDGEEVDVDGEEDESGPLVVTRFGHSPEDMAVFYDEYHRLKRKDARKARCCSKAWCCPSRSKHVRCLINVARLHPRICRCCLWVAKRPNGELNLAGALPRRTRFHEKLGYCALVTRRCLCAPPPEELDELAIADLEAAQAAAKMEAKALADTEVTAEADADLGNDAEGGGGGGGGEEASKAGTTPKTGKPLELTTEKPPPKDTEDMQPKTTETVPGSTDNKEGTAVPSSEPPPGSTDDPSAALKIGATDAASGEETKEEVDEDEELKETAIREAADNEEAKKKKKRPVVATRAGVVHTRSIASVVEYLFKGRAEPEKEGEEKGGDDADESGSKKERDATDGDEAATSQEAAGAVSSGDGDASTTVEGQQNEKASEEIAVAGEKGGEGSEAEHNEVGAANKDVGNGVEDALTTKTPPPEEIKSSDEVLNASLSRDSTPPVRRPGSVVAAAMDHGYTILSDKEVHAIEEAALKKEKELAKGAAGRGAVTSLTLDDNPLSVKAVRRVQKWLLSSSSGAHLSPKPLLPPPALSGKHLLATSAFLASLSLEQCDLGPRSTKLLVQALPSLPHLSQLNLACNPRLSVPVLAAGMFDPLACPNLAVLNVAFCEARERDLVKLVVACTRASSGKKHMRELELPQSLLPVHWSWFQLAQLSEALAGWGWIERKSSGYGDDGEDEEGGEEGASEEGGGGAGEGSLAESLETNGGGLSRTGKGRRRSIGLEGKKKHATAMFEYNGRRVKLLPSRWLNIDDLRSTKILTLGHLEFTDTECYAMSGSLGRNKVMAVLDLSYNRFGEVGAKAVLKECSGHKGLRVDLSGNKLTTECVGTWLWNGCHLSELRLSTSMALQVQQLKGIVDLTATSGIRVGGGGCGGEDDEDGGGGDGGGGSSDQEKAQREEEAQVELETLNLVSEDIGPLEQEALSHLLKFNNVTTELNGIVFDDVMTQVDLSLAPLDLYEVIFVAKRLDLNFCLLYLNLSGCAIDADGSAYLSRAVGEHKFLQRLLMDNNLLADEGARAMGRHLRQNVSLVSVDLSYNALGDPGMGAVLVGLLCGPPQPEPLTPRPLTPPPPPPPPVLLLLPAPGDEGEETDKEGKGASALGAAGEGKETEAKEDGMDEEGGEEEEDEEEEEEEEGDEDEDEDDGEDEEEEEGESKSDSKEASSKKASLEEINNDPSMPALKEGGGDDDDASEESEGPKYLDDDEDDEDSSKKVEKKKPPDGDEVALMEKTGPPPLIELDLSGNFAGLGSLKALGRSPMGADVLGRSKYSLLQSLSLRSCTLTDASLTVLAQSLYHDRLSAPTAAKNSRRSYLEAEGGGGDDDDGDGDGGGGGVGGGGGGVGGEDGEAQRSREEPDGARFPHLRKLDLTGHHAFSHGVCALCACALRLDGLTCLRLGKAMASAEEFADEEGAGPNSGKGYDGNSAFDITTTPAALRAIISLLEGHPSLTEVDLFNSNLGDKGAKQIAKVVDSNATLQTLTLDRNDITGDGGEALIRALAANVSIKTLSLAQNPIGRGRGDGHGAVYELSGALLLNNTLQILDLQYCDLNGFGKGGRGFDAHMNKLLKVLRNKYYGDSFTNLRIAGNKRIPKALLKEFRDVADPPLVIDLLPPNSGEL